MSAMGWFIVLAVLVILIDAWILFTVSKSATPWRDKRRWALMIIFLPVIGWIIWGRWGPRGMVEPPSSEDQSI